MQKARVISDGEASPAEEVLHPIRPKVVTPPWALTTDTFPFQKRVTSSLSSFREIQKEAIKVEQLYKVERPGKPTSLPLSKGREVGDDRVDANTEVRCLSLGLVIQEKVILMKTSKRDTFISTEMWDFCETTSSVPSTKMTSYFHARKSDSFDQIEFADYPPLRLIIDCQKGPGGFSSTSVGKSTMLGTRSGATNKSCRSSMEISSWIQDGCLRTCRTDDPKYMPSILGGSSSPPLFGEAENLHLYMKSFRGGGYDRLYGSATEEVIHCLRQLILEKACDPVIAKRLRDRQDYLYATYAEKVAIPHMLPAQLNAGLPETPLYRAAGSGTGISSVENRLIRTKHLVGTMDALKELSAKQKLLALLWDCGQTVPEQLLRERLASLRSREAYGGALQSNTAWRALVNRKASENDMLKLASVGFTVVAFGQRTFSSEHARWICSGGKTGPFDLNTLTTCEDMYALEEVGCGATLKVGGIPLRPSLLSDRPQQITTTKVGLYEISQSMYDWADEIYTQLITASELVRPVPVHKLLQIYARDREWVNDDTMLLTMSRHDLANYPTRGRPIYLVSTDKRLARQMSNINNMNVLMIEPASLYACLGMRGDVNSQSTFDASGAYSLVKRQYPFIPEPAKMYLDTGSIAAALSNLEEGEGNAKGLFRKSLLHRTTAVNRKGNRRSATYGFEALNSGVLKVGLVKPISNQREYKYNSYSRSSTSSSWRVSVSGAASDE